ncbi:hypothetical protein [Helicobacter felis]|uniref:hypothetical protein n=1 Tax=Helicobacter felis TaxID=214 RepID=UPI000CF13F3E|nr:hypothetical protein [Helicobacter felis]
MCVKGRKDNANGLEIYKPMSPNGQTCKYVVESYKYERVNETAKQLEVVVQKDTKTNQNTDKNT